MICSSSGDVEPVLSSIGVIDLAACIQAGWLVLEEEPDGSRPEQLVQLPLLTIEEAEILYGALGFVGTQREQPIASSLMTAVAEAIASAQRQGAAQ